MQPIPEICKQCLFLHLFQFAQSILPYQIYINPFGRNSKAELLRAKRHKSGSAVLDIYGLRAFRNFSRKARKPLIFLAKTTGHLFRQGNMVGVTGIEPAASWSQTRRATSCATPRNNQLLYYMSNYIRKSSKSLDESCFKPYN